MAGWSPEQDGIVVAFARLGASAVRAEIVARCGVHHSLGAVRKRASRLGVSLVVFETCPRCGARVRRLGPDGLCEPCHVRGLAARARERAGLLAEMESERTGEAHREAWREYDVERWRLKRARRAVRGDSVEMSQTPSSPR